MSELWEQERHPAQAEVHEAPVCPGCGRVMSGREAREQGECNDCHPGGAFEPYPGGRTLWE